MDHELAILQGRGQQLNLTAVLHVADEDGELVVVGRRDALGQVERNVDAACGEVRVGCFAPVRAVVGADHQLDVVDLDVVSRLVLADGLLERLGDLLRRVVALVLDPLRDVILGQGILDDLGFGFWRGIRGLDLTGYHDEADLHSGGCVCVGGNLNRQHTVGVRLQTRESQRVALAGAAGVVVVTSLQCLTVDLDVGQTGLAALDPAGGVEHADVNGVVLAGQVVKAVGDAVGAGRIAHALIDAGVAVAQRGPA